MEEVFLKTHLIITDIHEEYNMNWCGKIINTKPKIRNGAPVFIIIGTDGRIELNTFDMKQIEDSAKCLTHPKGKTAVTSDTASIYIQEEDDNEVLIGVLTHKHIKTFAPMHDKFGFR